MSEEIIRVKSANDFKNEIVKDVTNALKGYAETFQNPDNDKLLTRQEAADLLSISLVSLWDWTRKDLIPAYRIGNKVRYKKNEVLQALQRMNKFSS